MKEVREIGSSTALQIKNSNNFEFPATSIENSSLEQLFVYVISNRRIVEIGKNMISPRSQSTSKVAKAADDLGKESYLNQIAASQTGFLRYQETRIVSIKLLNKRVMEALKRINEMREEMSKYEDELENNQ